MMVMSEKRSQLETGRHRIIGSVVSPIGFYTLALLTVEAFLMGAGTLFNLSENQRVAIVWCGIGLIVVILGIVSYLVFRKPMNLVFTDISHLRYTELTSYGTDARIVEAV